MKTMTKSELSLLLYGIFQLTETFVNVDCILPQFQHYYINPMTLQLIVFKTNTYCHAEGARLLLILTEMVLDEASWGAVFIQQFIPLNVEINI